MRWQFHNEIRIRIWYLFVYLQIKDICIHLHINVFYVCILDTLNFKYNQYGQ